MDGVVNVVPVPNTFNDEAVAYHLMGFELLPPNTTVPCPHLEPSVPEGAVNPGVIAALTATRLLGHVDPA